MGEKRWSGDGEKYNSQLSEEEKICSKMDKSSSRKVSILFRAGEVAIKRNSIKNQKWFLLGSRLWTGKVEWGGLFSF